jgi:hypothetical protein|tara:strand:+ start:7563 stop:8438 length:876 start_codon:yes stop_codon:yes gene_type:complete
MKTIPSPKLLWGIFIGTLIFSSLPAQDLPVILSGKSESTDTGLKIEFLLSSYIERADVSSWIEQDNWFILNFYNIIRPEPGFFDSMIHYPLEDLQQSWSQNSLQLSFQISRKIGSFDVMISDQGQKVSLVITYSEFIQAKEVNPSFVFPDLKDAQKINHPSSWKDARERTTLEIICDTKGLPIYVDNQLVGYSPLKNRIDVLPGWHKVGYFSNDYTEDSNALTSKEKLLNDILVMGRLDVFIDEGKHETIALNYQTLDEDVIDYNKRFQAGTWIGFSLFFTMIVLMSWGMA